MLKIRSAARLSLTIGIVCASIIWLAIGIGIVPDPVKPRIEGRVALAKTVGTTVQLQAEKGHLKNMTRVLNFVSASNDELLSIGVHRIGKGYIVSTPGHERSWRPMKEGRSTSSQIQATIQSGGKEWGNLELRFSEIPSEGAFGLFTYPLPMVSCLASLITLMSWMLLSKTMKYMNPAKVVPTRVRSALDTLAEGLALVDQKGEIAHANSAFCEIIDKPFEAVLGTRINRFNWIKDSSTSERTFPWAQCQMDKTPVCGQILELEMSGQKRKFIVNSTPIYSDQGTLKGVLNSFDDVTSMESKKAELSKMIHTLRRSRDEVERQNEKLNFLASYDPMTNCMNRRSFWVSYEELWAMVPREQLSVLMVDIDKFKSVNDTYGHSTGDEVIVGVGELLLQVVGQKGIVCRYGGEEFTVVLPNLSVDDAEAIAIQANQELHERKLANLDIRASIGVSNGGFGAMDPQHLLDQADESLYAAKRMGRDRVIRFDKRPTDILTEEGNAESGIKSSKINYSSVTGLLSALSFRSLESAEHSIRVADLCLAVAKDLVPRREMYTLEIGALLHDIGKIGLPDALLNKTSGFTEDDLASIQKQQEVGVAIIQATFSSDEITDLMTHHHDCEMKRSGSSRDTNYFGEIPMAARVITLCDAFDVIYCNTTDSPSRLESAIEKVVQSTPFQFDPQAVEALVMHVRSNGYSTAANNDLHFNPQQAHAIGQNIELMCEAIASEDLGQLKILVDDIKKHAVGNQQGSMDQAVGRLENALDDGDEDLERLLELAKEVMTMCRSTRRTFVDTAEMLSEK